MSWYDIPTCKEAGVSTDYVMLRGIFMPAGATKEQVDFYVDLFKRVRDRTISCKVRSLKAIARYTIS